MGQCADVGQPLVAFSANDLLFYDGQQYPARFRDDVFVVFHGSWNRAPPEQGGYQVAFAPRADGEFTGRDETFAAGFAMTSPFAVS